jgi:hypothetical protein
MSSVHRVPMAVVVAMLFASGTGWSQAKREKPDTDIKRELIAASIAAYRGSCPCPYSTDRAGHRCGGRSAYSKPGGVAPLCYESDVTQKMVDEYRRTQKG